MRSSQTLARNASGHSKWGTKTGLNILSRPLTRPSAVECGDRVAAKMSQLQLGAFSHHWRLCRTRRGFATAHGPLLNKLSNGMDSHAKETWIPDGGCLPQMERPKTKAEKKAENIAQEKLRMEERQRRKAENIAQEKLRVEESKRRKADKAAASKAKLKQEAIARALKEKLKEKSLLLEKVAELKAAELKAAELKAAELKAKKLKFQKEQPLENSLKKLRSFLSKETSQKKRTGELLKAPTIKSPKLKEVLNTKYNGSNAPMDDQMMFNRLELLGDGVIYHEFCKILDQRYPDLPPSILAFIRCKLVSNGQIYHWALAYDLPNAVTKSKTGGQKSVSDIFEAYVGALFMDGKYASTSVNIWLSAILGLVVKRITFEFISSKLAEMEGSIKPDDPNSQHRIKEIHQVQQMTQTLIAPLPLLTFSSKEFEECVAAEFIKTKLSGVKL